MKYIILDRDGVINQESAEYIKTPDEWRPIAGSLEAIAQLNRVGYRVLIATNQSGVARGYYSLEVLSDIHEKMIRELASVGGYIEEIFYCPHHPDELCPCRKPRTGMIQQIQTKYPDIKLSETFFIGDSTVDMQAALSAGCKPLLVQTGNGVKTKANHPEFAEIPSFANLNAAVQHVMTLLTPTSL